MGKNLYEKVFEKHAVRKLDSGQYQLLDGFALDPRGDLTSSVRDAARARIAGALPRADLRHVRSHHPEFGTASCARFVDDLAEQMLVELERNCEQYGIRYLSPKSGEQGIVHVIGPELGLTQPGMTVCCGDSHTSTHGAFGAIAFGIGTDAGAATCSPRRRWPLDKLKVRRIQVDGQLRPWACMRKDVALYVIHQLGVQGGVGYAYEFAGEVFERFSMEERMTVCNMSIEGGARCGYINPDETTYAYLQGRAYAPPAGKAWDEAVAYWQSIRSDDDAPFDDVVRYRAEDIEPMVTWGITPAQSTAVGAQLPAADQFAVEDRPLIEEAFQ